MSAGEAHQSTYQIVVLGELRPAVLAFCAQAPTHKTSDVFQLRVSEGEGIADLAATLQAAGLMILSIRLVPQKEVWADTRRSA